MTEEAKPDSLPTWKNKLDTYFSDEGFKVRFEYEDTDNSTLLLLLYPK